MQKQLKTTIFGKMSETGVNFQDSTEEFSRAQNQSPRADIQAGGIQILEQKIDKQQRQLQELNSQLSQFAFQSEENIKAVRTKNDKMQSAIGQIEQNQESLSIETSQKIHFMQQKHIEQRKLEDGIQNLMDRQNILLKSYEVRLNQMQKLLAEKESQMLSTLAALNETKLEIQKIKRSF